MPSSPIRSHVVSVLPLSAGEVVLTLVLEPSAAGDSMRIVLPVAHARQVGEQLLTVSEVLSDGAVQSREPVFSVRVEGA